MSVSFWPGGSSSTNLFADSSSVTGTSCSSYKTRRAKEEEWLHWSWEVSDCCEASQGIKNVRGGRNICSWRWFSLIVSLNKVAARRRYSGEKGPRQRGEGMSACQGENCISAGDTVKSHAVIWSNWIWCLGVGADLYRSRNVDDTRVGVILWWACTGKELVRFAPIDPRPLTHISKRVVWTPSWWTW